MNLLNSSRDIEYHLWNFSRNDADNAYLQRLADSSPRIKIFNQFYEGSNPVNVCSKRVGLICGCTKCRVGKWSEPYKYYASNKDYENDVFVKIDDDVVFIDTKRFDGFASRVRSSKNILSANVFNNGMCASIDPVLRAVVEGNGWVEAINSPSDWWHLCTNVEFMRVAHEHFFSTKDIQLSHPNSIQNCRGRGSQSTQLGLIGGL